MDAIRSHVTGDSTEPTSGVIPILILRLRSIWQRALSTSRFGASVMLTMATNLLLAGLSVVSGILAARLLGPTGRGELAAIQTWPSFLGTFAFVGIPDSLVYFSAREPERAGHWVTTAMVSALAICAPFVLAGYFVMPWLLQAQSKEIIQAARIYLWLLPIQAVVGMLPHPLRGRDDLAGWNLLRPMPAIVWIAILLVSMMQGIKSPALLSREYLVGLALLVFPIGFIVVRRLPRSFGPKVTWTPKMFRYGLPSFLSTASSFLNLRLDQMLMAGLVAPQVLGLYVVGVAWSGALTPILSGLTAAVLPRVAGARSVEDQSRLLAQSTRLGLLLSLLLALGTALVAPLAIPLLFGRAYIPAVPSAIILSLASGVLALKDLVATSAMSLGRPRFVLQAEGMGLVVTVILLWMLLRPFQLMGAAIASLCSYSIVLITLVGSIGKQTELSFVAMLLPTLADVKLVYSKLLALRSSRMPDDSFGQC